MKEKILEMLELQDSLNSKTSWSDWRKWITNKWKTINWKRCIYMELAEAIDSISWKHWKNIEGWIDYENFKVELIDIWHFLMSELEIYYSNKELISIIEKYLDEKSEVKLPLVWSASNNIDMDKIISPYEQLMALTLWKENLEEMLKSFFICLDSASITFDDLYKLYIWKNVLNKFRQDNWYKEGMYIKIWNWDEDNVVMQRIIEKTIWFDEIYKGLEEAYNKLEM